MFLSPVDGLHGHSLIIEPTDILIAMSRGGESEDVLGMVEIAKRRGAETLAFVHNTQSALARLADKLLPIRSKGEYELQGVLATTSTVAFAAMCDAVCAVVIEAKGFPRAEFQEAHPGGAVGKTAGSAEGKGRPQ